MRCTQPVLIFLTFSSVTVPLAGQVTASKGPSPTPQIQTEEICPLQLDFDLSKAALGKSLVDAPEGTAVGIGTGRYTCDKARVQRITVSKEKQRRRELQFVASARLATDWVRQDVNLTIQLLVNGEVKRTEQWHAITIGTTEGGAGYIPFGGSEPKTQEAKWWISKADFDSWFSEGSRPSVRVQLEITP